MKSESKLNNNDMIGWVTHFDPAGKSVGKYKASSIKLDPVTDLVQEEIHFNADGSFNFKYEFLYDAKAKLVEKKMFLKNEFYHGKWLMSYNDQDQLVREDWYDKEDKLVVSTTIEYNDNGLVAKETKGDVGEWTNTYNEKKQLVKRVGGYFSADESDDFIYEYNERGILIRMVLQYSNGNIKSETIYEFLK